MSSQNQVQTAREVFYNEVVVPSFFEKLASLGVVPTDVDHAQELLNMGHKLMQLKQIEEKRAGTSRVSRYNKELDALLKQAGAAQEPPVDDQISKVAGQAALTRADLASAALVLLADARQPAATPTAA